MKITHLIAALLICAQANAATSLNAVDKFHLVTVSSHAQYGRMNMLMDSCKKNRITPVVLGVGQPYYSNQTKFYHMRNYLQLLPKDHIVMFVDAFDVLVIADKKTIVDKFLAMNVPILMSTEKNCYPAKYESEYPAIESPFRFVNSGTYIGYAGALLEWFGKMQLNLRRCDQDATAEFYLGPTNQNNMVLDTQCEIFMCLFKVEEADVVIDPVQKRVQCLTTNSFPCILHANAESFTIYDKVYEAFIK